MLVGQWSIVTPDWDSLNQYVVLEQVAFSDQLHLRFLKQHGNNKRYMPLLVVYIQGTGRYFSVIDNRTRLKYLWEKKERSLQRGPQQSTEQRANLAMCTYTPMCRADL